MNQKYQDWIENHLKKSGLAKTGGYGKCREVSEEMVKAFPELTLIKGHVYTDWGKRGHWWLQTEEGEIVDPTVKQFQAIFNYEPYKEGDDIYLGKCYNCGEEIWDKPGNIRDFCDDACAKNCAETLTALGK